MGKIVWGVFRDAEESRAAVQRLIEEQFPPDEIRVLMRRGEEEPEEVIMERKTLVPQGAAIGAGVGAVGAAAAVLATGGGALVAAGTIAGLLQASGMGAALGGIAGAMGGLGWWGDEAEVPEDGAERPDAVLVLLPVTDARAEEARAALCTSGCVEHAIDDVPEDRAADTPHTQSSR